MSEPHRVRPISFLQNWEDKYEWISKKIDRFALNSKKIIYKSSKMTTS